jgi:hypothetical protein
MSNRMTAWLQSEARRFPDRPVWPFRLTPGQYAELESETCRGVNTLQTERGLHPIERIECETRAVGDNVILMPREDLFFTNADGVESVQIFAGNSVTSIPDNVGCCEIASTGDLVSPHDLQPGDIAFIDFFHTKQGYIIQNEELYVAGQDAFQAKWDPINGEVIPMENMVVTRRVPDRMKIALTGTDRVHVLPSILTEGIAGGKNSQGATSTHIVYEEVVAVGPLTKRPRAGVMTTAERRLLQLITRQSAAEGDYLSEEEAEAINAVREEREGRPSDIQVGDLVMFCTELRTQLRVRGEFQSLIPYDNVLATIQDEVILDKAVRSGRAGKLIKVA